MMVIIHNDVDNIYIIFSVIMRFIFVTVTTSLLRNAFPNLLQSTSEPISVQVICLRHLICFAQMFFLPEHN